MALDSIVLGADNCYPAKSTAASEATSVHPMSHLQRPTILLVEDSEDDFFFFSRSLKQTGIPNSLFHVNDGAKAVSYFEAAVANPDDPEHPRPDLVFLDLKLPTHSGFEILAWIRQHASRLALDVTVLSGSEDESDIARAKELGARGYLAKPIAADTLKSRLATWAAKQASEDTVPSAR